MSQSEPKYQNIQEQNKLLRRGYLFNITCAFTVIKMHGGSGSLGACSNQTTRDSRYVICSTPFNRGGDYGMGKWWSIAFRVWPRYRHRFVAFPIGSFVTFPFSLLAAWEFLPLVSLPLHFGVSMLPYKPGGAQAAKRYTVNLLVAQRGYVCLFPLRSSCKALVIRLHA